MKIGRSLLAVLIWVFLMGATMPAMPVAAGRAMQINDSPAVVVHAVLFYSPSCPHCHTVIQEVLPPLQEEYGEQMQIVIVDVSQEAGQYLYYAAIDEFQIPRERLGVPALIVDDVVLVGSLEIPERLPGLIASYLEQGGVDWPRISGLREALGIDPDAAADTAAGTATDDIAGDEVGAAFTAEPEELERNVDGELTAPTLAAEVATPEVMAAALEVPAQAASDVPAQSVPAAGIAALPAGAEVTPATWQQRLMRDPAGNGLALVVLAGMLAALVAAARPVSVRQRKVTDRHGATWLVPCLSLIGIGVAAYMAYIETTQTLAVCGPVGDCNTVQQSPYAQMFGIPVAIFGLLGYLAILGLWAARRWGDARISRWAAAGLLLVTGFGVLFSIYLTFLEPFVIGATCLWCVSSAVIMAALFLLTAGPGRSALGR